MTTGETAGRRWMPRDTWIPLGLGLLSFVPVVAGAVRVHELATGAPITDDNARFFAAPAPIVLHVVGATAFALLGAGQVTPSFRRRHRTWHRRAGGIFIASGVAMALSGLWMQATYELPPHDGPFLGVIRVVVGVALLGALLAAVEALRRGRHGEHGAWMIRAYSLGMGAGTQAVILIPWMLAFGMPPQLLEGLLMTAGWAVNVGVAEVVIRRRSRGAANLAPAPTVPEVAS